MDITRAAGKLGIPGLYVTGDPGGIDDAAKHGSLSIRIGLGWAKSHSIITGQCAVMRYHRGLMQMILHDRAQIAKAVNATVISLDDAPKGYDDRRPSAQRRTHTAGEHAPGTRGAPPPRRERLNAGCAPRSRAR